MALPKIHRLRRRQDFSKVYQTGLRRSTAHLTLRAVHCLDTKSFSVPVGQSNLRQAELPSTQELLPTCLGISVSQKVSKRAVVRNRIKRRIRAAFQHLLPRLLPGWQLVIVVKPSAIECGYGQFLQELEQLFVNAEVMDGH